MKKRLKQAFMETKILLGWLSSQLIHNEDNFSDDLMRQMTYAERKYDKMARRLGYQTRGEELKSIIGSL